MRFALTDDQVLFRDTVRALLNEQCPPSEVRRAWGDSPGHSRRRWADLAGIGVMGLTVPGPFGGLGMGELELSPILEEAGRVALPEPLLETVAVAAPLIAEVAPAAFADSWLPRVADGAAVVSVAMPSAPLAPAADLADLFVVGCDSRVVAVERSVAVLTAQDSVDGARHLARVTWSPGDEVTLVEGDPARSALDRAFDRGALGAAAVLLGLADHLLAVTVDYVRERRQFGVPVGSFQAVKHHLADVELGLAYARPVVLNAAYALAHGSPNASRDVSAAKCLATEAAERAARSALQCHGAIGYTVEHDLHMWLKRVWALAATWGDAAHHRHRVAQAVLGDGVGASGQTASGQTASGQTASDQTASDQTVGGSGG